MKYILEYIYLNVGAPPSDHFILPFMPVPFVPSVLRHELKKKKKGLQSKFLGTK